MLSFPARLLPLEQGVDSDSGENRDDDERAGREDEQAAVAARRRAPLLLEDVVEDLVPRPGGSVLSGADDPLLDETMQYALRLVLADVGVTCEISRTVSDLGAGRRDKVVVDRRCRILLLGRQCGHRPL